MNEIADYLAAQREGLGVRFLRAVKVTCATLADSPELAGRFEAVDTRLADLRVWPVHEFPNHLILYRIKKSYLEIFYVVYGGRDLENLLPSLL